MAISFTIIVSDHNLLLILIESICSEWLNCATQSMHIHKQNTSKLKLFSTISRCVLVTMAQFTESRVIESNINNEPKRIIALKRRRRFFSACET